MFATNISPKQYVPGYVAFSNGTPLSIFEQDARNQHERADQDRMRVQHEKEEQERVEAAQKAKRLEWETREAAKQARLERIRETAMRAEVEWLRMGGRILLDNPADAELRHKLDDEANLTEEERTLKGAWAEYDKGWDRLVLSIRPTIRFSFRKTSFTFLEIPWPILRKSAAGAKPQDVAAAPMELHDLTPAAVRKFLLHPLREPSKSRRDKLRDAVLRFHPDKFSRYLHRIVEEDRARAQEGVVIVTKCLNELMSSEHE